MSHSRLSLPSLAVVALLSLTSTAAAQHVIPLEVVDGSVLHWTADSNLGALVAPEQESGLRGRLGVRTMATPHGPAALLRGVVRLEATRGALRDASGAVLGHVSFSPLALGLDAPAAAITPLPAGGFTFDWMVAVTYLAGHVVVQAPGGVSTSTALAGTPADSLRLVGDLTQQHGEWRLAAPLRLELEFGAGTSFSGTFTFTGPLRAGDACSPATEFCPQAHGAPTLAALAPTPGGMGSGPALNFEVRDGAPSTHVVLVGGRATAPVPGVAGRLCIGAPRAPVALGTTDAHGTAVLSWRPTPSELHWLASGRFAVQAYVRSHPAELTNGLALELCHRP